MKTERHWLSVRHHDPVSRSQLLFLFLLTAREGNVFTGVCHSVHNRAHVYSVTAHPCWLLSHLLRCGRYASYWNAFLYLHKCTFHEKEKGQNLLTITFSEHIHFATITSRIKR